MKKNLNEYVNNVCDNICKKIKVIDSIVYHYELSELLESTKKLSNKEVDEILEQVLNKYLLLLKPIYNMDNFRKIARKVDDITDFFATSNDIDSTIVSDGDTIADNLLGKLVDDKDNKLNLPVKIEYLKEYSITSLVDNQNVIREILWIIVRFAAIHYCLTSDKN